MRSSRVLASVAMAIGGAGAVGATTSSAAPVDSGIHGLVLYGPTCPVERPGQTCERPLPATVIVGRAGSTRWRVRTRSGRNGRFTLHLRPGRYLVKVTSSVGFSRTPSQTVSVTAHRFTAVTIRIDSGIR